MHLSVLGSFDHESHESHESFLWRKPIDFAFPFGQRFTIPFGRRPLVPFIPCVPWSVNPYGASLIRQIRLIRVRLNPRRQPPYMLRLSSADNDSWSLLLQFARPMRIVPVEQPHEVVLHHEQQLEHRCHEPRLSREQQMRAQRVNKMEEVIKVKEAEVKKL